MYFMYLSKRVSLMRLEFHVQRFKFHAQVCKLCYKLYKLHIISRDKLDTVFKKHRDIIIYDIIPKIIKY